MFIVQVIDMDVRNVVVTDVGVPEVIFIDVFVLISMILMS